MAGQRHLLSHGENKNCTDRVVGVIGTRPGKVGYEWKKSPHPDLELNSVRFFFLGGGTDVLQRVVLN